MLQWLWLWHLLVDLGQRDSLLVLCYIRLMMCCIKGTKMAVLVAVEFEVVV